MKNIVTIDFDIIMAPCIGLYNNLVPSYNWDELKTSFPQMQLLNSDLIHYSRLTNWLYEIIPQLTQSQIIFIENHGALNKFLPLEKINVYNIDHHHDCGYGKFDPDEQETLNCGNWVYDIARHDFLNSYTWIKNTNSNEDPPKYENLINQKINLSEFDLKLLPKPDLLFLCLSEPWTPPEYRPLYYLWKEILDKYYNYNFIIDRQIEFEGEDYYGTLYK